MKWINLENRMASIFMNSASSKTSDSQLILLDL